MRLVMLVVCIGFGISAGMSNASFASETTLQTHSPAGSYQWWNHANARDKELAVAVILEELPGAWYEAYGTSRLDVAGNFGILGEKHLVRNESDDWDLIVLKNIQSPPVFRDSASSYRKKLDAYFSAHPYARRRNLGIGGILLVCLGDPKLPDCDGGPKNGL